jgi:hypothetical protein
MYYCLYNVTHTSEDVIAPSRAFENNKMPRNRGKHKLGYAFSIVAIHMLFEIDSC